MRFILQRVKRAAVTIDGLETRSVEEGLMVLAGVQSNDDEAVCDFMLDKMINLRIFDDENGNLNLSLLDVKGQLLLISNFTLYAQCKKGRRPSYTEAAPPDLAETIYNKLVEKAAKLGLQNFQTGTFAADMQIDMLCDGPVTIMLDSDEIMPQKR